VFGALLLALAVGCSGAPTSDEKALADIRDTTIIPNLGSFDDQVQKEAVQRLLNVLDRAPDVGKNLLVASLRDPVYDDRTKIVCAWLLSTVGDRRALPSLMEFLGQGTDTTESLVREAVVSYGAGVVPAVSEVLAEGNDLARLAAAEVLVEIEVEEGLDALRERYPGEPEARIRFLILCALAGDPRPSATQLLDRALADEDPANRQFAWGALTRRFDIPASLPFDPNAPSALREEQVAAYLEWRRARGR
jgi:HEAT repeat protein